MKVNWEDIFQFPITTIILNIRLGTDIVYIPRIQAAIERYGDRFLQRVYTPVEQQDSGYTHTIDLSQSPIADAINPSYLSRRSSGKNPYIKHLAGRWAAKEAVVKALGTGFRGMRHIDIEIRRQKSGAPQIFLYGAAAALVTNCGDNSQWQLSISHDGDYSIATALLIVGDREQ